MSGAFTLRRAEAKDVPTLLALIKALAVYEREPKAVKTTEADLLRDGFGRTPHFFATIAEMNGEPAGFALWFFTYSTWVGRPGMYLEDLFVKPEHRGYGIGRALFADLARTALEHGYGRIDWKVLDWNLEATKFYERLGAKAMREWFSMRIEGEAALRSLAVK